MASTEPHLPSFSGVNWFQYVAKSERMAPLVEMLPTNFASVEASLLEPESDPEPEVDPGPELAPAPEEDEEPDPELEVSLVSSEPELDVEGLVASLLEPESAGAPAAPSSFASPLDAFSPGAFEPDDPQATRTDKAASGK